eukprot:CAMPEP_0170122122 /NCGR_PEP_ID=MMETSP0020_2-20130122/16424_1 /TAXON_ID=98059 /ORGANISM="Dinobryon sp., Strain UTEXLB2267" /LENGTH=1432 /DNA_ID=CAMNT_0010352865 /DNA_START=1024 /DNA_END=5322 /DNA_ORIENTATION=+
MSGDSWTPIQYEIFDSISVVGGAMFCDIILLLGQFFLFQLIVAILSEKFAEEEARKKEKEKAIKANSFIDMMKQRVLKAKLYAASSKSNETGGREKEDDLEFAGSNPAEVMVENNPSRQSDKECTMSISSNLVNGTISEVTCFHSEEQTKNEISIEDNSASLQNNTNSAKFSFGSDSLSPQAVVNFINSWDKPNEVRIRQIIKSILQHKAFEITFGALITLNTVVLAYDHYPMADSSTNLMDAVSFLLTIAFVIEMIVQLVGLGIVEYFSDEMRIFDFVIAITSLVDAVMTPLPPLLSGDSILDASNKKRPVVTVFRSIRFTRALRLFRSKTFKAVLMKVFMTLRSMNHFFVLLFLFLFVLALLGMQFFANTFRFDEHGYAINDVLSEDWANATDRPRSNFDNFTLSFLSIFQCMTVDNWSVVLWNVGRAQGPVAMLFPIGCYLFGSVLLANLFLAILIRNFTDDHSNIKSSMDKNAALDKSQRITTKIDQIINCEDGAESAQNLSTAEKKSFSNIRSFFDRSIKYQSDRMVSAEFLSKCQSFLSHDAFETFVLIIVILSSALLAIDTPLLNPDTDLASTLRTLDICIVSIFSLELLLKSIVSYLQGTISDFIQNGWNILDIFVVVVSILSSAGNAVLEMSKLKSLRSLRALRPLRLMKRIAGLRVIVSALIASIPDVLKIGGFVFMVYFIFAVFFTSLLKGQLRSCQGDIFDNIISTNPAYLDFLTYPTSWLSITAEKKEWFGPKSEFNVSWTSCSQWPSTACCPQWSSMSYDVIPTSRIICECWGAGWFPVTKFRFDNVAMSLVTLFDIGTIDNWTDIMHLISDSRDIDMQPVRDNQLLWCYGLFLFVVIGNYFCLQLFVGTITDSFEKTQRCGDNGVVHSVEQHIWLRTRHLIDSAKPMLKSIRSTDFWPQSVCYDICHSSIFYWMITFFIVVQFLLLSMTSFGESDEFTVFLNTAESVLALLFAAEALIKNIGFGIRVYFQDNWNRLDFCLVVASVIGLLTSSNNDTQNVLLINILRLFRVIRLVRLLKNFPSAIKLFDTIILSLPGVANVSLLVFLILFVFSVICMNLYAKAAYNGSYNDVANFRSFGITINTLVRMLTGDNWGQFMYDLSEQTKNCAPDPPYNSSFCGFNDGFSGCIPLNGCGDSSILAIMLTFMIVMTLIILSVFISMIISTYREVKENIIQPRDVEEFLLAWSQYDPNAKGFIAVDDIHPLVSSLAQPLGFGNKPFTLRRYLKCVGGVKFSSKRKVSLHAVLHSLCVAVYCNQYGDGAIELEKSQRRHSLLSVGKNMSKLVRKLSSKRVSFKIDGLDYQAMESFTVGEHVAANCISRCWLRHVRKKKMLHTSSAPVAVVINIEGSKGDDVMTPQQVLETNNQKKKSSRKVVNRRKTTITIKIRTEDGKSNHPDLTTKLKSKRRVINPCKVGVEF